ncbi:hypothetical protein Tco_0575662 [Tanacetum coccineum]
MSSTLLAGFLRSYWFVVLFWNLVGGAERVEAGLLLLLTTASDSSMEINIEVNGALFTVKNKSNLRLQLTVLTKLSCRWITHNYVLHSMPADFELGVADVGVALAAATAASSGHWMDQILKTHCSLLIYESIFQETTQPLFTIARGGYGASRSNTPAGNTGKLYLLFLGTNGTVLSLIPDIVPMKVTGESQQTLSPHIKGSVLTQIAADMGEEAMNLAQKLRKGIFTIQQAAAAQIHQQHNGITIGQKIIMCFRFTCVWLSGYWAFSTSVASTVRSMLDLNGFQWRRTTKLASFMDSNATVMININLRAKLLSPKEHRNVHACNVMINLQLDLRAKLLSPKEHRNVQACNVMINMQLDYVLLIIVVHTW